MSNVPEQEREEVKLLLKNDYGIDLISLSYPDEKTHSSSVYVGETNAGKVVVKESTWYSGFAKDPVLALEEVYTVSFALLAHGVSLPKAYVNKSGKFVALFRNNPWVVLEWKEGKPFSGTHEEFKTAGRALAQFHKAGVLYIKENKGAFERIQNEIPVEKPYEESRALYASGFRGTLLSDHVCSKPEVCRAVREHIELLDRTIQFIDESFENRLLITQGVLHNDFNYQNGLYDSQGNFSAFIDVDQLGVGPCVDDIGNTLASFSTPYLKNHSKQEFAEGVALFLRAYHDVFPLPISEYILILPATERWDVMRILRSLHRHHFENDRLSELLDKITGRFLKRVEEAPTIFSFITREWLEALLKK